MAAASLCMRRLAREARAAPPSADVALRPDPSNLLVWHVALRGAADTPYAGGEYHAVLTFTEQYPAVGPTVVMLTPSGRFVPGAPLCMPRAAWTDGVWNPAWTAATVAVALHALMMAEPEDDGSGGSIVPPPSAAAKAAFAAMSRTYNRGNAAFASLFPDPAFASADTDAAKAPCHKRARHD